ncbi:MAG: CoA-binding protein [Thermodesulfobacteriota bacterium]|nr:CoA-binding protein [Thermodesulfobacteriota bacterium]
MNISANPLEFIFQPRSIAVIGASADPRSLGYHFVRHLIDYGYRGKIYPINPKLKEAFNITVYPNLGEVQDTVDYVICCISASKVVDLISECSSHGVKAIHLFTGRLSETGRMEAIETERQILKKAKEYDIRLIGPNCAGVYYPGGGISFSYDFPKDSGCISGFFQSGGAATEFIRYASLRGIRFSKIISYGNAIDLNETDFLQYFSQDKETKVIVGYIEGVKDGRTFLNTLKSVALIKPVIIIKGGRSNAGMRSAASHTASIAGSIDIWEIALKQSGAILAESMDDLIDLAVSFSFFPEIYKTHVGIAGGGGGRTVLSADEWEEAGFNVIPLPDRIKNKIREVAPDIWDWIGNPGDRSMMEGSRFSTGDLLKMMSKEAGFDLLIANVTDDAPFEKEIWIHTIKEEVDDCIDIQRSRTKPLAVILRTADLCINHFGNWRWEFIAEQRTRLIDAQIPVFSTFSRAAKTIGRLIDYYQRRSVSFSAKK